MQKLLIVLCATLLTGCGILNFFNNTSEMVENTVFDTIGIERSISEKEFEAQMELEDKLFRASLRDQERKNQIDTSSLKLQGRWIELSGYVRVLKAYDKRLMNLQRRINTAKPDNALELLMLSDDRKEFHQMVNERRKRQVNVDNAVKIFKNQIQESEMDLVYGKLWWSEHLSSQKDNDYKQLFAQLKSSIETAKQQLKQFEPG